MIEEHKVEDEHFNHSPAIKGTSAHYINKHRINAMKISRNKESIAPIM